MKRVIVLLAVLVPAGGLERGAEACGGCFSPPGAFTAVSSHRMVIALGAEETVLWDQFIYTGAPEEFAWVLPVPRGGAVVELAADDFVAEIDAGTAPIVQAPESCAASSGGCDGPVGGAASPEIDGVEVRQHRTVGPYETVTIDAEDPDALYTWLGASGYAFPDAGIAALDHYIAAGSSFVVLRLRPGAEVSAMRPVRVRFRGFMGSFPLEMVTLGATGTVELSLFVIAEQRHAALNYPTVAIDAGDLVWDWADSTSSYDEVFDATIDEQGGRAWVTEFAGPLAGSELARVLQKQAGADLAIATRQVAAPYLTRLRTRMLVDHIDQDLELGLSEDATDVSRTLVAGNSDCGPPMMSVAGRGGGTGAIVAVVVLAAWLIVRRRRPDA
jgi:hypothetical protein